MRFFITSLVISLLVTSGAWAQSDRSGPTQAFVALCISQASPELADPEPTCACGAGVISGAMSDSQYEIMGQLAPYSGDDAGMERVVLTLINENGYTADDIIATGQLLIDLEQDINRTCGVLER